MLGPPVAPGSQVEGRRALQLLADIRALQTLHLRIQGVCWGLSLGALTLVAATWVAASQPRMAYALLALGLLVSTAVALVFALLLPRRRVGDDVRTARLLANQLRKGPWEFLAAVELQAGLSPGAPFSSALASAFLSQVDQHAASLSARRLVNPRPAQVAMASLGAVSLVLMSFVYFRASTMRTGVAKLFADEAVAEAVHRQPITGDIELTYRYPAYTGLEPHTIPSSTGEVSAPKGTEVTLKTRADRDVSGAVVVLTPGGTQVPLQVAQRDLSGSFVINESGQYYIAFLSGSRVVAQGPNQSITVEADLAPQVRVTSPLDGIELDSDQQAVTLKFEAKDDYGVSALKLRFTVEGGESQSLSLKPDEGRATRGTYQWNLAPLSLRPGQTVSYFLEATDNDAVSGPKSGVSNTLHLKLYSAEEHRREALAQAEALWGRLIDHLADRMEGSDRASPTPLDAAVAGKPVDERGTQLAGDSVALVEKLREQREPPEELVATLFNISSELGKDVAQVVAQRRALLRVAGREGVGPGKNQFVDGKNGAFAKDLAKRLASSLATDIQHSEKNVLYLEALLDRAKLDAIRELAQQLREDRKELSKLLEDFGRTQDSKTQQALLNQMQALKQRMLDLQQRMAELSKGIRDDFMNAEALQQMQEEFGLQSALDQVEQMVKEGKADEALKKMQELAMELDDFLEKLDEAGERADEQSDPELARQFEAFQQNLEETVQRQQQLSEKTKALRDKYRQQQKERIARQGEALKKELKEKLEALENSWKELEGNHLGFRFDAAQSEAARARENVVQSLDGNDFDLASESADALEEKVQQMAQLAEEQRERDELFQNPPEVKRASKQTAEKVQKDAVRAKEIAQKLRDLFPQPGQQMSEKDRQQMAELARGQKEVQQQAHQLQQQMDALGERAPLFDEESQQQMGQVGQRMQAAGERLAGKDASRGFGEQQGALQGLRGIQQAMEDAAKRGGKGGKGGIPMPMRSRGGRGRGDKAEKVELPEEDPNAGPKEFRQDVMDAMKQGAPDRYRDQNKKYYEELVK